MVVDTSILLAIFFGEKHAEWAAEQMNNHARELRMSTVNLAETLIRAEDRQPQLFLSFEEELLKSGIRFIAPDVHQSRLAAKARLKFPLNLGDCFAYALAMHEGCPILTLDQDFRVVDCSVIHP